MISLPIYIKNTSEIMCDFAENKSFVCVACNKNYMNYKSHIKTLKHHHNIMDYDMTEEYIDKMEIE